MDEDVDERPSYVRESYAHVPELGRGRRWYDVPYRILNGFTSSRLGRRFPRWAKGPCYAVIQWLYVLNDLDRKRSWSLEDELHNVDVPSQEHVNVPAIWVVEYFPPSCIDELNAAIVRQGWDSRRQVVLSEERNIDLLNRSRKGSGPTWWRMATVSPRASPSTMPMGVRQKLPAEFDYVELMGVTIGNGLTAVVAKFGLTHEASTSLDAVWHARHEPRLVFRSRRLGVEDRMFATFRATQEARRRLHDTAREWLSSNCPGAFAKADEQQPLMDLLLLDEHDPSNEEEASLQMGDALRALGINDSISQRTSINLPGILLEPVSQELCPTLNGRRSWTLWGQRERITSSVERLDAYGNDANQAISHVVHESMSDFFVRLGLSDFLQLLREQGAAARDSARIRHGKFGRRDLKHLRDQFLTSSLDTTSIQRDLRDYNERRNWRDREAAFTLDLAPWVKKRDELAGRESSTPIDLNAKLRERQAEEAAELLEMDKDYRDILSTVASLGASIDAFKIQRYAIWIAILSLVVALLTMGLALNEPEDTALLFWDPRIPDWIRWAGIQKAP